MYYNQTKVGEFVNLLMLFSFDCHVAHKNVVLFISHLGKSSEIEAVYTATPVLAIPLFGDQFSNAANIEELGVGKVLDIHSLTKASLLSSILEILQNGK